MTKEGAIGEWIICDVTCIKTYYSLTEQNLAFRKLTQRQTTYWKIKAFGPVKSQNRKDRSLIQSKKEKQMVGSRIFAKKLIGNEIEIRLLTTANQPLRLGKKGWNCVDNFRHKILNDRRWCIFTSTKIVPSFKWWLNDDDFERQLVLHFYSSQEN